MGCDIHMYIEYKESESESWHSFGGKIGMDANYDIFAKMANVRNSKNIIPISEPKGIPDDIGFKVMYDYTLYVNDDEEEPNEVDSKTAIGYILRGVSVKYDEYRITNPDWHSASWLSLDEYSDVIDSFKEQNIDIRWIAVLEAMKSLKTKSCDVRLVFWFDN